MGILDGHGPSGHCVAHFAQEHLPGMVLEALKTEGWKTAVLNAVAMLCRECQMDPDMAQKANQSGTTMTLLMVDSLGPSS